MKQAIIFVLFCSVLPFQLSSLKPTNFSFPHPQPLFVKKVASEFLTILYPNCNRYRYLVPTKFHFLLLGLSVCLYFQLLLYKLKNFCSMKGFSFDKDIMYEKYSLVVHCLFSYYDIIYLI